MSVCNFVNQAKGIINSDIAKRIENIELNGQFKAPEMEDLTWLEIAKIIKYLPANQIALILKSSSEGIVFTKHEKIQVDRALSERMVKIDKIVASDIPEKDRTIATEWKEYAISAREKLE